MYVSIKIFLMHLHMFSIHKIAVSYNNVFVELYNGKRYWCILPCAYHY